MSHDSSPPEVSTMAKLALAHHTIGQLLLFLAERCGDGMGPGEDERSAALLEAMTVLNAQASGLCEQEGEQ